MCLSQASHWPDVREDETDNEQVMEQRRRAAHHTALSHESLSRLHSLLTAKAAPGTMRALTDAMVSPADNA